MSIARLVRVWGLEHLRSSGRYSGHEEIGRRGPIVEGAAAATYTSNGCGRLVKVRFLPPSKAAEDHGSHVDASDWSYARAACVAGAQVGSSLLYIDQSEAYGSKLFIARIPNWNQCFPSR